MKPKKRIPSKADQDAELAKRYGSDPRTIRNWRTEGAPLDDPGAMAAWLGARKNVPAGSAEALKDHAGIADIATAKLQKVILECEKLQAGIDREKRKLVPIEEVIADITRIAAGEEAEDMRLVGDVGTWEGLSAAEMKERATSWLEKKRESLQKKLQEIIAA